MITLSSTITGEAFTSPLVAKVHRGLPSLALTAWTVPDKSPTTTTPPYTAGEDSPIPSFTLYFQSSLPSARVTAIRSADCDPTYTIPSAIAADDSIDSPAS